MIRMIQKETARVLHSRVFWLLLAITVAAPFAGVYLPMFILGTSANTAALLAPVKMGALLCSALFAVFTIYETDRVYRSNVSCIIETAVSMLGFNAAKTLSIIITAISSVGVAALANLLYSVMKLGGAFDPGLWAFSFFAIMLPAVVFGILISSGLYMLFRRMDISLLIFIVLFFISCNVSDDYIVPWVQTNVPVYSDYFGNWIAMRTVLWNRLVWALLSVAVFTAGIIATRRYEKNAAVSIGTNAKKAYLPAMALSLAVLCCLAWAYEPYFDNSKDVEFEKKTDKSSGIAVIQSVIKNDRNDNIKVQKMDADISVNPDNQNVSGKAVYALQNTAGQEQKLLFMLEPGYSIQSLMINGKPSGWEDTHITENNAQLMYMTIPLDANSTVEIEYGGSPQAWRLMQSSLGSDDNVTPDYIGLSGQGLVPSLGASTGYCESNGQVTLPDDLIPIMTGRKNIKVSEDKAGRTATWSFHDTGLGLKLFAGRYNVEEIQAGGIDIEFYYNRAHEDVIKKMKASQTIEDSVNYFTNLLGELDYNEDNPLKIVEASALMMGGKAIGNISTIGEKIFDPETFASNPDGTTGTEVLAHEICHQWWGIAVRFPQATNAWTDEGLTVFTTYMFLQHQYGDAYAQKNGVDAWEKSVETLKRNFYYRHPEYRDVVPQHFLFNILGMNNQLIMYYQMPLEIYKAEQILGDGKFKSILSRLYRRYKNRLSFDDFLRETKLTEEEIAVV